MKKLIFIILLLISNIYALRLSDVVNNKDNNIWICSKDTSYLVMFNVNLNYSIIVGFKSKKIVSTNQNQIPISNNLNLVLLFSTQDMINWFNENKNKKIFNPTDESTW